tara:strand:- start:79 stop:492 length:414 start_codon:yes stop_codon:yes gene_type:complete
MNRKMNNALTKALLFVMSLSTSIMNQALIADDHSFESWNDKQFENNPFDCVEDGATPEYTRCFAEKLNKYDWELRKELNDDKLWNEWRDVRGKVCYHYKTKHFGQGTIKPLMTLSCEMRLNTEVKRFCLSGEDKKCG